MILKEQCKTSNYNTVQARKDEPLSHLKFLMSETNELGMHSVSLLRTQETTRKE